MNHLLWTAMVTPLRGGEPDLAALEPLVREQEEAGNGLLVLGSTGEALNLELAEKKRVLDFVLKLKPKVPVMAGVGGVLLKRALDWVGYLETLEVQAYLMVTPLYAKPGAVGQELWFRRLLDASSRPVMLYNIPGRAGVALSREALGNLSDHPRLWAVKEAGGCGRAFGQYKKSAPRVRFYCGDDAMWPEVAPLGGAGLVSVASNVWPKATALYARLVLEGQLAGDERVLWQEAAGALFQASNPVPVKALLASQGRIPSDEVRPPLSRRDLAGLEALKRADRSVGRWFQNRREAL